MRPDDERYFERLESGLEAALGVARRAREHGGDPTDDVEIPIAKDMADRVENILGIDGVAELVREMEADPDISREEAALELAADFADGTVGDYDTRAGKVEGAVRTAVALLTEGVVAAPIEGIDRVELLENDDGSEFINIYYAGPIRSAGGTAQALSVLVADYTRTLVGIEEYRPRGSEVERYAEELSLYDDETGLQYAPKDAEAKFIARNTPIMLDGEATGDEEVSGFRDLERVDTNNTRGGMCLVLGEGIAQKAPKIQRYTRQLEAVDWPWLQDLIDGNYGADDGTNGGGDGDESGAGEASEADGGDEAEPAGLPRPEPSKKFLRDLIAGRPVFGHPSETGGFRLRYGRARNHGFATVGVHPATMHLVDDFLATGTQIKTERPGKAAGVVPVDSIEGPTVRLANGDVRRVDDPAEALEIRNGVDAILDLGEYLVNYGEFVENNYPLSPAAYAPEWWRADLAAAGADVQALEDSPRVDLEHPTAERALEWAEAYDAPLHPEYTYLWHDLDVERFDALATAASEGYWAEADGAAVERGSAAPGADRTLVLPRSEPVREALEVIVVEHTQGEDTLTVPDALPLVRSLGLTDDLGKPWTLAELSEEARTWDGGDNAVRAVNEVAPFEVRERAPTRVGCRMGRPEKSEKRDLSPAVHTLFPIGEAGGSQRDVAAAGKHAETMQDTPGLVELQVGRRRCRDCGAGTHRARCPDCGGVTNPHYVCRDCDVDVEPDESGRAVCPNCQREADAVQTTTIDVNDEYRSALQNVGERENAFDVLKGVKGLSSAEKVPEPIEKGVLRAKHGVSSFKDGTVRYDMTDLPVTSVRPRELDVSADRLRSLGYETDVHGDPLTHEDQLVELRIQDVVLSSGAAEHMLRTADFVDDLLESYYGMEPFYEVDDRDDLVGELVFGMAPHTSAAVVGRVIGFTSAAVGYAHPYFHAAKRRNCDGDEDCVMLLMDGLINFSKTFLPDQRGGSVTEDTRLVAVGPDGDVEFHTFGEFWEELDSPVHHDGKFEKKLVDESGWRTYVFDEDHRAGLQPIERAIRYEADPDETLLRVETQFGRSLDITEHHSLFRYDDGIEEVAGADLRPGDHVLAPRELDVETTERRLDVIDAVDEPYVVIDDHVEDLLRTVWEEASRESPTRAEFKNGLAYRLRKNKIPYSRLDSILEAGGFTVPGDVMVARWGSETGISRTIDIDRGFAWLLGMFVAEGSLSGTSPTLYNSEKDLIDHAASVAEAHLGTRPTVEWSNKSHRVRFPSVFADILYELGVENRESYSSSEKIIPDAILRAPEEVALSFIKGFLAGDGGETDTAENDFSSIQFHTTSEHVKDGFVFLAHRFGTVANVSRRERDASRQPIYAVSVSGGSVDNPLRRVLNGEESYLPKSLTVGVPEAMMEIREMDIDGVERIIPEYLRRRENVSLEKLREMIAELERRDLPPEARDRLDEMHPLTDGDLSYLRVTDIREVDYDGYLYDLQVGGEPIFTANWLYAHNSMDAPLVMSSRIDPAEIDDEAHNMDIVSSYPREFYEATREMADPGEVEELIRLGEDTLGTEGQYRGFEHTHDTGDIALGPDLSAYKTLGDMMEKMDAQLELSRKLRSVDETDVAERVIEYHFLPDIIGNLRAFSRQETRCKDCGEKYRRMPLTADCRECGGDVTLTVYEGSVNKYIDTALQVAEEYDCREYTRQRLRILDRSVESIFEDDTNKQSGIEDFM